MVISQKSLAVEFDDYLKGYQMISEFTSLTEEIKPQ
jgi:hypothetical protein